MVRLEQPTQSSISILLHPLDYIVWLCIMAAVPAMAMVVWAVNYFYPGISSKISIQDSTGEDGQKHKTCILGLGKLTHAVWFSFGALLTQGINTQREFHITVDFTSSPAS